MVSPLRKILEEDPTQLLAAFALGGDRGMGMTAVAEFLGRGVGEVWDTAARVGSSGILSERGKDDAGEAVLAVAPATLRAALLHEVFFSPAGRAWVPLLRRAESLPSALETLVLAAHRQVPVPRGELQGLLRDVNSREGWQGFAALGEAEGAWALEHYPGSTADIAAHALRTAPTKAIRRLIEEAEDAAAAAGPRSDEFLEIIRDWIEEIPNVPDQVSESLRRRRLLVEAPMERMEETGDPGVALRAAFLALSPRLESTRMTATGGGVVWRHGSLPASAASEMLKLWERVRGAIRELDLDTWKELANALHWWLHPNIRHKSEDGLESFHRVARQILTDLVPFAEGKPGLTSALRERADDLALDLDVAADPVFEILYPRFPRASSVHDLDPVNKARRRAQEAARNLAAIWAERKPEEVLDDLARFAEEARWHRGSLGTRPEFEDALVHSVERPERWLSAVLETRGHPRLGGSFLYRVAEERRTGWEELLERCLRTREYSWAASTRVLRLADPPQELLDLALEVAEPQAVETACLQGEVPTATLGRLLTHDDRRIAVAAATGEWLAEPRQSARAEVQQEWRDVILHIQEGELRDRPDEELWLQEILVHESDLAFDWLRVQLSAGENRRFQVLEHGPASAALRALESSHRIRLLRMLPPARASDALLLHLVDTSPDLYRELLRRSDLRENQLAPLAGRPPDERWTRLARLAIEAGYSPRRVADASFHPVGEFSPGAEHYTKWETAFRALAAKEDPALREVAKHGLRQAERLVSEAREEDRQFELTGRL